MRITPLRGMTVDSVHFSNYGDSTALVVKPKEENGHYIADIPNILLQDDQNIVVYSVNVSEGKVETIRECVFPVRKRAKPSTYVYTETEILNYATLAAQLDELKEKGVSEDQISRAVQDYLARNPVGVPAGGKTGQYLRKKSDADRDVEWADLEIPQEYGLITYDQDRTITIT